MSLLRRRMMENGGSEEMNEWKLLAVIDASEENPFSNIEFEGLNITEIFMQGKQLINASESTISTINVKINDLENTADLDTVGYSKVGLFQYAYLKYNGLFWERMKSAQVTSMSNYIYTNGNKTPYNVNIGSGKCEKLKIYTNTGYELINGTIDVYAR